MKYKELPECDSADEFKVGDRAIAYKSATNFQQFTVRGVSGHSIQSGSAELFHFKQCRKVEEVKPRELEICLIHHSITDYPVVISSDVWSCKHTKGCAVYRFREVLDD